MAEAVEIRMRPAAGPASGPGAELPWARRACCLLAAEIAVLMRARALGERALKHYECYNEPHYERNIHYEFRGLLMPTAMRQGSEKIPKVLTHRVNTVWNGDKQKMNRL